MTTARRRVAITGYGALCPMGESADEIWRALLDYRIGYRRVAFADPSVTAKFFGFVERDAARYKGFPKTLTRVLPEFAKFALVAARQALAMAFGSDAGLEEHYRPFDRAVMVGTGWGGLDAHNANLADYRQTGLATSFSTLVAMGNAATAAIGIHWNMRGCQMTPVAACATGSIAIGEAAEAIRAGRCSMALAGASESMTDDFNVWSIDVMQALSKEQTDVRRACCPFSRGRSGFVLSEGAAVLCLEDMDSAVRRGAAVLGEVTGYGSTTDATDMTAPADDLQGRVTAIGRALEQAGRRPGELGYVNTHGTSTPLNDANENAAIKEAMGQCAYGVPMSSTKSYTGHLVSAAGALEAIFCLKAMASGVAPATVHLDEPDPDCDLDYVPNQHRRDQEINAALNLSFGFGGANAALVLEKAA
jgi:3-oxoacyl-[acyl-carrier-protein] synthase II